MSTKDVAKYLVENGYNIELIKNANNPTHYNSEHLILECQNDIIEFGKNEKVKMYLDNDILYIYTLCRYKTKLGTPVLECTLKEALDIFNLQNK